MAVLGFGIWEVTQIAITILAIGYIFSGWFKKEKSAVERMTESKWFDWENVKFSAAVTAPAIIFHELGHKFAGLAFGYVATYQASYFGLALGVFLRIINSGFIFFIPGYVVVAAGTPLHLSIIAFAGPAVNLVIFGISWYMLTLPKYKKHYRFLTLTRLINIWLFVFNMLPIPPLDGYKVYWGLYHAIKGVTLLV